MNQTDIDLLNAAIKKHWHYPPSEKVTRYVGKFFDRTRLGSKIVARVEGNHGTYTLSVEVKDTYIQSACSCYIGKQGGCHHCYALALTFLQSPESFDEIKRIGREEVKNLDTLGTYLKGVSLESLLEELKAQGISQKAFAESIGMSTQHLGSIKRSELRNRYYHGLGATKLACVWVLEHHKKFTRSSKQTRSGGKG